MLRPLALAALVLAAGCAEDPAPEADDAPEPPSADEVAVADITPIGDGSVTGTVTFTQLDEAVEVRFDLANFAGTGAHGVHVHQTGDCGPDSTGTPGGAAGGHFNPLAAEHGGPDDDPNERHAGDLGNVTPEAGRVSLTRVDSLLALDGPTSVLGRALIVHAGRDDLESQPSGDAGPRVGCGLIRAPSTDPDTAATAAL